MKKVTNWIIIIVFILLFLPVPSAKPAPSGPIFKIDKAAAEGYIAFVANEMATEDNSSAPSKCECGGTKVITHGDGHKTPCQCLLTGDECNCSSTKQEQEEDTSVSADPVSEQVKEEVPDEPKDDVTVDPKPQATDTTQKQKTILYFTASWCGPCQSFKATELPKIQKTGLSTSSARDGKVTDIEVIDIDKHRDMYTSYNCGGVPYIVILNDKHEIVKRYQGYTRAETILEAWNGLE